MRIVPVPCTANAPRPETVAEVAVPAVILPIKPPTSLSPESPPVTSTSTLKTAPKEEAVPPAITPIAPPKMLSVPPRETVYLLL